MNAFRKNIQLDYIHTFVRNFNLTHAFWLLYLALKGFSLLEIGIFEAIFHLTSFTMEIPTGIVADLYGRKTSRIVGIFVYLVYLILMLTSTNFWVLSIGFVFCALSYTFESGAGDALIYDSYVELQEVDQYRTFASRKEILFQTANIGSAFAAGLIAAFDYDLLFEIMIGVFLLTMFIVFFMTETTVDKVHESSKYKFKHHYMDSFYFIKGKPEVTMLIVFVSVFTLPTTIVFLYAGNYLHAMGFQESMIGVVVGVHSVMSLVGAFYIGKAKKTVWIQRIVYPTVTLLLLWLVLTKVGYIAIILLGTLDSMIYVVFMDEINQLIPSEKRATILSISGMLFSFMMIVLFPFVGWLSEQFGFVIGFGLVALFVTSAYVLYLIFYRRLQHAQRIADPKSL